MISWINDRLSKLPSKCFNHYYNFPASWKHAQPWQHFLWRQKTCSTITTFFGLFFWLVFDWGEHGMDCGDNPSMLGSIEQPKNAYILKHRLAWKARVVDKNQIASRTTPQPPQKKLLQPPQNIPGRTFWVAPKIQWSGDWFSGLVLKSQGGVCRTFGVHVFAHSG